MADYSEWGETQLGELCRLRGGSAFPPDAQGLTAGELPFIKVSDMNLAGNEYRINVANNFIGRQTAKGLGASVTEPGSVVFAKIGAAIHAERFRIVTTDTAFDNNMMAASARPEKCDGLFLYYLLKSLGISQYADGSALPYLKQSTLSRVSCRVPGRSEQRAIAEVLGALDDKIAANSRLTTTSDHLAHAMVRSSLVPAQTRPLSEIALVTMGSSPPGTSYNEERRGIVFYQGVRDFGVRFPINRVWTAAPIRMAARGDTLLSVRAPVGEVNIAAEATCIGRGLASIRSTDGSPNTLFHLLRDEPSIWAPYEAEGTVFGSINRAQLEGLQVPVVDDAMGGELEDRLDAIERRVACAVLENDHIAATRDALLPALMSGTLRVRDAERAVEQVV